MNLKSNKKDYLKLFKNLAHLKTRIS